MNGGMAGSSFPAAATRSTPIWGRSCTGLLPSPALRERSHRSLACLLIAVRGFRLILAAECPLAHPGAILRRDRCALPGASGTRGIGADEKCVGTIAHKSGEGRIDLAGGAGVR